MDAVALKTFSFRYPGAKRETLKAVNLQIEEGSFALFCGKTGSGKTTLLKCLKHEISPVGEYCGERSVLGEQIGGALPTEVGFVMQSPENQIVMDSVWHELAFGLENAAVPAKVIRRRIAETANFFGIEPWIDKKVSELSGGQKQILNLAAVMAMQPRLLILDEPTAQLDPIAAKEFLQMLQRVNTELGITVLLSEHRMENVLPIAKEVVFLENGGIRFHGTPQSFAKYLYHEGNSFSVAMPAPIQLAHQLGERESYPLTIREGREWLAQKTITCKQERSQQLQGTDVLTARNVWFRYDKTEPFVLKGAEISLKKGEIHAVVGGNGSGKSTLLHLLCGVYRPTRGKIKKDNMLRVALLSQNPKAMFIKDTVLEDLLELKKQYAYTEREAEQAAERLGLTQVLSHHPYDLSGGEMQKAALAKLLLLSPDILLLDEPTKGLDALAKRDFANILRAQKTSGRSILLVTHDLDFAASVADRCSMLFHGTIACTDYNFFAGNAFYTTGVNRMTRGIADGCVTMEDVVITDE